MEQNQETILAVDVSSTGLETLISDGGSVLLSKEFSNNKRGCNQLFKASKKYNVTRCAFEATGGYEQLAAGYFYGTNVTVNILNPARVRKYARSLGILAKTDKIDASVIERYAREAKPKANFESSKSQLMMKQLITRREALKRYIVDEKYRKNTADKVIARSIHRHIKYLEKEIAEIEKAMDKILEQDVELQKKTDALTKQIGIAKITAFSLISRMPELGHLNNQQVASLAGLAPFNRDSGNMRGRRHIQAGRFHVRRSLYMPAWSAVAYDKKLKSFYERLTGSGKPPKVAIVAVMRKMIIEANSNMKQYYKNTEITLDI